MATIEMQDLFRKYLEDRLSGEEFSRLYEMMNSGYDPEVLDELLKEAFSDPAFGARPGDYDPKEIFASLLAKAEDREQPVEEEDRKSGSAAPVIPLRRLRYWIAGAAAALVLLAAGSIYWNTQQRNAHDQRAPENTGSRFDAPPGKNGAILTLSDGKQVELDSARNGSLAPQGNTLVLKQGGQLSYTLTEAGAKAGDGELPGPGKTVVLYNTMTTPRGRQFQLLLADGTRVWLNAASSIRFPTAFNGKERRVQVSGEAYFEVADNKDMPFIVELHQSEIVVLGTHFNVADYQDEENISTTLLEGSVKVGHGQEQEVLTPGRQADIEKRTGKLSSREVDVDQAVAWTRGRLALGNSDFPGLMRQISRWYDVDITYEGKIPDVHIGGFLHRDVNLSTVLDFLSENGVHYKTKGKTITLLPR